MKKNTRNIVMKFLSVVLVFVLTVMLVNPMTVEAKVIKKTLKNIQNSSNDDPAYLESISYKVKPGHYRFKIKKKKSSNGYAYIKFMAPKAKDYSFTVNKVQANNKKIYANGYFNVLQKLAEPDGFLYTKRIANSNMFSSRKSLMGKTSRKVVLTCHKGNVFYIGFYVAGSKASSVQFDFTIK